MGAGASTEKKQSKKSVKSLNPYNNLKIEEVKEQIKDNLTKAESFTEENWRSPDRQSIVQQFKFIAFCDVTLRPQIYSDNNICNKIIDLFFKIHKKYLIGEVEPIYDPPKYLESILWNGSDISNNFCQIIIERGILEFILKDIMAHWRFDGRKLCDPDFITSGLSSDQRITITKGLLGILHNALRNTDEARKVVREVGGIESLQKILAADDPKSLNIMIEAKCNINLAYIVREDETDKIDTNERVINFIAKLLEGALASKTHKHRRYNFAVDETLLAMNKLAVSDCNKELMSKYVPLLVQVITEASSEKEQDYAVRCLWTLSFNEKCKEIIEKPENLETIKKAAKSGLNAGIKKSAQGVLWQINQKKEKVIESNNVESTDSPVGHIMLSYQWAYKPIVLKIRDFLKSKGYHVWIDIDSMSRFLLNSQITF